MYHSFSVTSMVMNPQVKTCFVNKQLTVLLLQDNISNSFPALYSLPGASNEIFQVEMKVV